MFEISEHFLYLVVSLKPGPAAYFSREYSFPTSDSNMVGVNSLH